MGQVANLIELNGVAESSSWSSPGASHAQGNRHITMALLRGSAIDSIIDEIEAEAAPARMFWSQEFLVVMMTGVGVLVSSVLGALLFLR
jgi:hypothetical protein